VRKDDKCPRVFLFPVDSTDAAVRSTGV